MLSLGPLYKQKSLETLRRASEVSSFFFHSTIVEFVGGRVLLNFSYTDTRYPDSGKLT